MSFTMSQLDTYRFLTDLKSKTFYLQLYNFFYKGIDYINDYIEKHKIICFLMNCNYKILIKLLPNRK